MEQYKNTNKKNDLLTMFVIILFFCLLPLYSYVFVHHQILLKNDKCLKEQANQVQENKKKLEKIISNETKKNENNSQNYDENSNLNDDENEKIFRPSKTNKFPSFEELIGFKEEKKAVEGFIKYLKNKEDYEGIGEVKVPLGILMHGVPGTGKTTLARAVAKEADLPFFEISSSLFSQKYKGQAVELVKSLFETARKFAEKKQGAIIFLDECETIFVDLSTIEKGDSEVVNIVNQFKTEMTSLDNNRDKPIFIIGATNHISRIDEAIKSRFTYNIEVKVGNEDERKKFFEFLINKRKNPYSDEAKKYLTDVINKALEQLPANQEFKKANRTLENILDETARIFAENRSMMNPKRNEINKEDLRKAFEMIISPKTDILDKIENENKTII